MEYVASLREGVLEAYTSIVTGLKNANKGMTRLALRYGSTSNPMLSTAPFDPCAVDVEARSALPRRR